MQLTILKSKIHRATITDTNINYNGSLTIDPELMKAANIHQYEKIHVLNINNGARFETYALNGKIGSKEFCLNGAGARLGMPGDKIIILTYVNLEESCVRDFNPIIVLLDDNNHQMIKE